MAPVGEDDHQGSSGTTLVTLDASSEVASLHQRLAVMEEDNASLRESCDTLQKQLDQVQKTDEANAYSAVKDDSQTQCQLPDKCHQCELLTEELRVSRSRCEELKGFQQQLEEQVVSLQTQLQHFQSQEKDLSNEVQCLEEKYNETHNIRAPSNRVQSETHTHTVPNLPLISGVPDVVTSELQGATDAAASAQELLSQCQRRLKDLENENKTLQEQYSAAEIEKTNLRTNIRKVSANWFERKTRLSDSDSESHNSGEDHCVRQDSSGGREEVGVQVPEFVPEVCGLFRNMEDIPKLLAEISFATGKLDLTERMCCELRKRVKDYENVIDDQEIVIHGLKDQLDTYFNDNQIMSEQLRTMTKLFDDLELTEKTQVSAVNPPDTSSTVFSSLPSEDDFKEMSSSVSKTYTKLKELILEKKSLVTEIERLKVLNVELQRRVTQQESRLSSVSGALHSTWLLVSDMKEQHARLHTSESILRYELKEKRELLHRLRDELECSREQWHKIRQMNSESEEAWNSLREELNERRRMANEVTTLQSNEKTEEKETEGATAAPCPPPEFEPPVDLLLDMAIEYGVIDADDDTSTAMVAAMEGEDMHANRLQELEDQCSYLYQKLMASTARSLTLASRLSALHEHYGSSDDDDDDDDDDMDDEYDDNDYELIDNIDIHNFDSELLSPDPESSDTAYMSEADTGSATSGITSEEEGATAAGSADEAVSPMEETADIEGDLSKRLINFLPRKIEILHRDNKKLEERYKVLQEEKVASEAHLTEALEGERRLRQQLEEKLDHLGKCVDELKLERNGKISEAEENLKQKVASLSQREEEYECLQEEIDALKDKFEERGRLLHMASSRVTELETAQKTHETSSADSLARLNQANRQMKELQGVHNELNQDYEQLKSEVESLHQQIADLRFQVSSKDMERDAAVKADQEKLEALSAATIQITEQEARISLLEHQAASEKKLMLSEQDKLSSRVNKLTQDLEERERHYSSLADQLHQAESTVKLTQESLTGTQSELSATQETSTQLSSDNEQLREKVLQLLSRRVRVCDDCFSIQAELAAIVATPAQTIATSSYKIDGSIQEQRATGAQASSSTRSLPISSGQHNDEDYAVISDDEVQSSRLSSSPSSGSPPSNTEVIPETRATADVLTTSSLAFRPPTNVEVWVGAGTRTLVPVELPAGVILQWNFTSEPKSMSFSVLHQPPPLLNTAQESGEVDTSATHQRVLIPTTRVASTQGSTIKGRLKAKQPGVYTLVFDNSFSRYTAKKVTYSLKLEEQPQAESSSPPLSPSPLSFPSP